MKRAKHPPLVEVVWLDAVTYAESFKLATVVEQVKLATRTTSGYLLAQTADGRTIIAHTSDPDEDHEKTEVADITVIPTGWVQSVHYRRGKPRVAKKETV